jgi:RNA polymerase sigma factor (TIGR02999 family)
MPAVSTTGITELLNAWTNGDSSALEKLAPLILPDLHRIAKHHLDRERSGHTLQTTALVNEAYLRLVGMKKVHWKDRVHFFAASAQLVRHILVDAARARRLTHARRRWPHCASLAPQCHRNGRGSPSGAEYGLARLEARKGVAVARDKGDKGP